MWGFAYDHHVGLLEQTRRTRGAAAPTAPTVATGGRKGVRGPDWVG